MKTTFDTNRERLKILILEVGSQAEFARRLGKAKAQVHQWLKGPRGIGDKTARYIEQVMCKPTGWLDQPIITGEVTDAPLVRMVPLISFVQAGGWVAIKESGGELFAVRSSNPGPHAFALRVEGDSMTSDSTPTFPEGTIIIVDPDRSPKAGDYVVARHGESATFKKLMTDGAAWYLRPLNRDYRPIEIDDPHKVVVGVVIEYWTGGRL
jgi:SOS-response transcriptional repressor LexA